MKKLLVATAALALICQPAFAQDITNSPNSAASGSNSAANSGSVSNASNGGVTIGPIDSSSRTNSQSNSDAVSGSISGSESHGGSANAASNAITGPSTANATTGAATSTNDGNEQNITFNSTNPDSIKTVPQVYAPALTTTLSETCMGSSSGGASGLGWGVTLGSSWRDDECVRRLTARELAQTLGDQEAARAVLCGSLDVYDAYERVGRPCPKSPRYKPEHASLYMPQRVVVQPTVAPQPPEDAPPTIDRSVMAPIPNPPEPAPKHPRGEE